MDLARVHVRFYGTNSFIRGATMVNWTTNFNTYGMYKRMWYPPKAKMKIEGDRIHIQAPCQFITVSPVGIGMAGITGDLDEAITLQGLHTVIGADLHKLIKYAKSIAPPMKEQVTEAAFITAFNRTANEDGEIIYVLNGVVHTDARLIPAITQI